MDHCDHTTHSTHRKLVREALVHKVVHVEDANRVCARLQVLLTHSEQLLTIHIIPGPVQQQELSASWSLLILNAQLTHEIYINSTPGRCRIV
jgi:hypothetical protein